MDSLISGVKRYVRPSPSLYFGSEVELRARLMLSGVTFVEEERELNLIRESVVKPEKEDEAKLSLLSRVYRQVLEGYDGRASNGGLLAPLPDCVKAYVEGLGGPCRDDMLLTYNAIRVLMARYMSKNRMGAYVEAPSMVFARVALGFKDSVDSGRLYRLLAEGYFMFNSPTLFNMYADGARGTLSACYVTPVYDDMGAILDAGVVQAMTFKYGGGQGFSFSELRPRWDIVKGTGGFSSGPLSFMHLYDVITETVKQGGKRRGANMGIMHAWHPDIYTPGFDPYIALRNKLPPQIVGLIEALRRLIEDVEAEGYEVDRSLKSFVENMSRAGWWSVEDAGFVQAKEPPLQDANLTNFNISVGVNDLFMKAVLEDDYWWMVNPKYSDVGDGVYRIHYSVSRATGLGIIGKLAEKHPRILENPYLNIYEDVLEEARRAALKTLEEVAKALGSQANVDSKNVHTWRVKARELWEEIVENAWAGGDPGVVYFDNHNKWSPTPWLGAVVSTNPCSEQPLYPFENCNLGSFNLAKYVSEGKFDLAKFYEDVHFIVDAMDSAIDINNHPDARHYEVNLMTRKIGLGVMGLADALASLNIPYDSEEAVAFTLAVTAALEVFSWKRSWELGAELGHAPAFECSAYDWRRLECVEKGDPELLSSMHVPALVKAGHVMVFEDGWVKLRYHEDVRIPGDVRGKLVGLSSSRVEDDGSVRLVAVEALERVLSRIFGVTRETLWKALEASPLEVVKSPQMLLALAIYTPVRAWEVLRIYGRALGARAPRNTVTTTVAPTGTISIISGTSSGIEPYFALTFKRQVAIGTFLEVNRAFREDLLALARKHGLPEETIMNIYEAVRAARGSIRRALPTLEETLKDRRELLEELKRLAVKYATAMDIDLWYHIAHQAASQVYVDQAISKTANLPKEATVDDVYTAYMLAWLSGLKGFTIYRDESKGAQVIVFGGPEDRKTKSIIRKKSKTPAARMTIVKKSLKEPQASEDSKLREIFEVEEKEGEELVLEITENSQCKTCER